MTAAVEGASPASRGRGGAGPRPRASRGSAVALAALLLAAWAAAAAAHSMTAPLCMHGKRQSPINILRGSVERRPLKKIVFRGLQQTAVIHIKIYDADTVVGIIDKQVIIDEGPLVTAYNLHSFKVLSYSDHQIYSNLYPFEIQMFFIRNYQRAAGDASFNESEVESAAHSKSLVVLSYLLDISDRTTENPHFRILAYEVGRSSTTNMHLMHVRLDSVLLEVREYFWYVGSLTSNPCTEGVQWIIVQNAEILIPIQAGQFDRAFRSHFRRPVQKLDHLKVYHYVAGEGDAARPGPPPSPWAGLPAVLVVAAGCRGRL